MSVTQGPVIPQLEQPTAGESTRVEIEFQPSGKTARVPLGVTVFDVASWNALAVDSTCGGHGTCRKCKVQIISGDIPHGTADARAFNEEELEQGWRLACQACAFTNLKVNVPELTT